MKPKSNDDDDDNSAAVMVADDSDKQCKSGTTHNATKSNVASANKK